jgi:hypothetical protein
MKMSMMPSITTSQNGGSRRPAKIPKQNAPQTNAQILYFKRICRASFTFFTTLYEAEEKVLLFFLHIF